MKELSPIEKLVKGHVLIENAAKDARMRILKGKMYQASFEAQIAQKYGYEKHDGFWIKMEIDKENKLVLPEFAKEAFAEFERMKKEKESNTPKS